MEGVLTTLGRIAGAGGLGVGYGLFFPFNFHLFFVNFIHTY